MTTATQRVVTIEAHNETKGLVYSRVLKGYKSEQGLKIAIENTIEDFRGFLVTVKE